MIGKAINQSMPIDACQLIGIDWYWPIDNHSKVFQTSQPLGTIKLEVVVSKLGDFSKNLEIDPIM